MPNDEHNSENVNFSDTTRFLANALHEIRTPIQTIIGAAELIKGTKLDKEQKEYIRQIMFSAEGLLDLANNILDLAKMNQSDFQIENIPFDIAIVTEHLVDSESVKAFNRGVELVLDISSSVPAMVTGDSMRVRQIMLNLINNAVKFTNEGFVHVELDYSKSEGIRFTVTDSGIGISEEKQKKLFTDYFQADLSTYRLFGGTGLGLSISKNLVNIMGGKIGVKSNPEGGSVFWFTLPLPVAIDNTAKISCCKNPSSHRILIVDDSELAATSLKNKLRQLGFTSVDVCSDCDKAIDIILKAERENSPYELSFINMLFKDGIDGWHLAFNIKNSRSLKFPMPLYLLAPEGQMHEEAKMKILDLFKGYLYKPIKTSPLVQLLKSEFCELKKLAAAEEVIEELVPLAQTKEKAENTV
ncbi:MAG: response regulator, partial [Treponema sp.]|nr:response regulator [Treponema sp.]